MESIIIYTTLCVLLGAMLNVLHRIKKLNCLFKEQYAHNVLIAQMIESLDNRLRKDLRHVSIDVTNQHLDQSK